ncbi:SRPBCC family protein [Mesorhizobium sp.]|uniref:SRPBCC family protein n=1 Tax=Mesorhizobium sp. TaxID=1871066 RepID=UPI00120461F4|nr:SRPBCC family protein [Mesorhizobium sp.]TIS88414.1 MAG: hypothetical protein E5W89_20130 [Mesorhizobium sp.]
MAVILLVHDTFIAADSGSVFTYVADLKNETIWQEDINALTFVSEGPLSLGSRFVETRRTCGVKFRWEFEITNLVPGREIQIDSVEARCHYRGGRSFTAMPGGTRVTEYGELYLPYVPQLLSRLVALLSRRSLRRAYARLKEIIENQIRADAALPPVTLRSRLARRASCWTCWWHK